MHKLTNEYKRGDTFVIVQCDSANLVQVAKLLYDFGMTSLYKCGYCSMHLAVVNEESIAYRRHLFSAERES